MLAKLFAAPVALLMLVANASAQSCDTFKNDGHFKDIQVKLDLVTNVWQGSVTGATLDFQFFHPTGPYQKSMRYKLNGKKQCFSDGNFCVTDRFHEGSPTKFGYTLHWANGCSNYWASLSQVGSCPFNQHVAVNCVYSRNWQHPAVAR